MKLKLLVSFIFAIGLALCLSSEALAQKKGKSAPKKTAAATKKKVETNPAIPTNLPKVTQVDGEGLLKVFKREGDNQKPLLVNFWATWCGPCVEEFPDLVKIDNDYKGKIDFITVTLDDLSEINTSVPIFLSRMKAEMPTYLLQTEDPSVTISAIYKDWSGGLPFTILFDSKGATIYNRQGKVVVPTLQAELDKLIIK